MELKNFFAQDTQGNVIPSPTVYLYLPGTTTLASGLKNKDGSDLTNPFTGTNGGQISLAAPDGNYDLRVVGSGRDFTMRVRFIDSVAGSADILRNELASTNGSELIVHEGIPVNEVLNRCLQDVNGAGVVIDAATSGPSFGGTSFVITSGNYVSNTGVITLNLESVHNLVVGDSVRISAAVGAKVSPKLNDFYVANTGTNGSTVVLQGPTGLGNGTFSGGNLIAYAFGAFAYRMPTESMKGNFLNLRMGGYNFERDDASWLMQVLPNGINIGSPNSLTASPVNAFEVGGGDPGRPNGFFGNAVFGRDWARVQVAPDNGVAIQNALFVGGLSAPYLTTTASSATYDAATGLVTVTLAADVGLAGYNHVVVSGASGTGDFALLNGSHVTENGTSGTKLIFKVATGLTMTISGMTIKGRPAVVFFADGNAFAKKFGAGGASFVPTQSVEGRVLTGAGPATSGTSQSGGVFRAKADSSSAVMDFGINGGSGGWLVATNSANLSARYPIVLGDGGNVLIGTSTNGASKLRVVGITSYADNAAAIAAGLTAGDVYHTSGVLKIVI